MPTTWNELPSFTLEVLPTEERSIIRLMTLWREGNAQLRKCLNAGDISEQCGSFRVK